MKTLEQCKNVSIIDYWGYFLSLVDPTTLHTNMQSLYYLSGEGFGSKKMNKYLFLKDDTQMFH